MPCVSEILVICPHDTSYLYFQHLQGNIEQRSCWMPMLIIPGWKINMKQPLFFYVWHPQTHGLTKSKTKAHVIYPWVI